MRPGSSSSSSAPGPTISFGRDTVRATFELPGERVEAIRREAREAGRALPEFEVTVVGGDGAPVARVHKTLSVRPRVPA